MDIVELKDISISTLITSKSKSDLLSLNNGSSSRVALSLLVVPLTIALFTV